MGVQSLHPDFPEYYKLAELTEVFYKGECAVKKQGTKLLPALSGQSDEKYKAYKDRALVFSAVQRTVSALVSTAFRKEPFFVIPTELEYLKDDCTGTGVPLISFAMRLCSELLVSGRAGILVDIPREGGKPYFVLYDGDDITNWDTTPGSEYVVLSNDYLKRDPEDKFNLVEEEGYRELSIEDSQYVVNLWEKLENGEFEPAETFQPLRFGRPLDFIPFTPVSAFGVEYELCDPPMLPLAQICHKHYMTSADYALALHVVAIPTPVVTADIDKDEFGELKLGPDACLLLPSGADAKYLEFSGQGIDPLEKALNKYEGMMAALGARMILGQDKSTTEKAAGIYSRDAVANSVLTSLLTAMEVALNKSMKWAAYWLGVSEDTVFCRFNKELIATAMDANTVNAIVAAYQNGSIDVDTLFFNLNEGGFISAETDKATFIKNLEAMKTDTEEPQSPQNDTTDTEDDDNAPV